MTLRALFFILFASVGLGACASSKSSDALDDQRPPVQDEEARRCGQSDEDADFAGLQRGSLIKLYAQDEADEDVPANWSYDMRHYLGYVTRVTELVGVDASGCPGVRVEADGGVFFWRVRDVERIEEGAEDDRCGQSEATANYMGLEPGDTVTIQDHRPWYEEQNWVSDMDEFVGSDAKIDELSGVDAAGCPGVTLDIDEGQYFWRVRDLKSAK